MAIPDGSNDTAIHPEALDMRALTPRQERKLVDYLDEKFLQLTRNFKKRTEASSKLQTLTAYLDEARHMLAFILQIPPIDPSTSLRIAYLLRFTGDTLGSIPGYRPKGTNDLRGPLQDLADFLDDLDQAWVAVLKCQAWDPNLAQGIDLVLRSQVEVDTNAASPPDSLTTTRPLQSSPPSQTDRTRLKSLLISGEAALEEWMVSEQGQGDKEAGDAQEDVSDMLSRLDLLEEFDSLFARTLDILAMFSGDTINPHDAYTQESECTT